MRLRHIEVFHAVMQTGSVSKAAELLGISQPAASKVLGHAESALGFRLFERIKGRLRPTAEAAILFVEAEKIQQGMGQVRSLAENLQRRPEGRLHIGCLPSLALSITPRAVKAFRELHPTLTCQLETGHIDGLVRALRARQIDLALTFAPREHAGIRMQLLGEVELLYLGPVRGPGNFDLATLDPAELVRIADSDIVGRTVSEALGAVGVTGRVDDQLRDLLRGVRARGRSRRCGDRRRADGGRDGAPRPAPAPHPAAHDGRRRRADPRQRSDPRLLRRLREDPEGRLRAQRRLAPRAAGKRLSAARRTSAWRPRIPSVPGSQGLRSISMWTKSPR
jgi:DNA-binding transcriptional LysR family regulator